MWRQPGRIVWFLGVLMLILGCDDGPTPFLGSFREVPSPAAAGSAEPNLTRSPNGQVYLSWVAPGDSPAYALRFSVWQDGQWTAPRTVAEGDDWFVNWADFPSVVAVDEDWMAAHWLAKSGEDTYAYNVTIAISRDGGQSWSAPLVPHDDGTPTEHGFVSLLPLQEQLLAVWLDGRNYAAPDRAALSQQRGMTLRAAWLDSTGTLHNAALLDERTCDCCQTAAARTASAVIVAYRDRSETEIRDISVVRYANGQWSAPQPVHDDGWEINGCPVNGPALAAQGDTVAVAWYTEARQMPRVKVAFSVDGGRRFGTPVVVDDGHPIGRVDVALDTAGAALVSWLEVVGDSAEIRIRRVSPDGTITPAATVARTTPARSSGFPHLIYADRQLLVAWTRPGEIPGIKTAVAELKK